MNKKVHTYSPRSVVGIDRRSFLKGSAASGSALALSGLWPGKAYAEAPKRGGHFRIGVNNAQTTDSLDPATTNSVYMHILNRSFRSFLAEIAPDNSLVPELAESWEASSDVARWAFKLRRDVEFHNGKSVTSQDVVASIRYHITEDSTSPMKPLLASVERIEADGDNVVFTLSAGNADFPYIFTDSRLPILPSEDGTIDPLSRIGAGGYELLTHESGLRSTFKRFENYWKPNRAFFDTAEMIAINDVSGLQSALLSNNVDAIDTVARSTARLFGRDPAITVEDVQSGFHVTLAMDTQADPFTDNEVRLALKYAVDREAMINTILSGYGTIGNDHPISPNMPFWADLEQRSYDPDRARYHLQRAGIDRLAVTLSTSDAPLPGAVDACLLFQSTASSVGVEVNLVREPQDGYWSDVWLNRPFFVGAWGARPTPDMIFSTAYAQGAAWNETKFQHERFNTLLTDARAQQDTGLRAEMYHDMQQIVRDEGGAIVPFFQNYVTARRANVMHAEQISTDWALDSFRAMERWWFA